MQLHITWNAIKSIRELSFVKNAYLWLILVPIIAKALEKISTLNEIVFILFGQEIILNLSLPFNWALLYFSAVSFIIGEVAFKKFCPIVVAENHSYYDFLSRKDGYRKLKDYCSNQNKDIKDVITELAVDEMKLREGNNSSCQSLFEYLYEYGNTYSTIIRNIIFLIYSSGILLMLIILGQNFYYVAKYI